MYSGSHRPVAKRPSVILLPLLPPPSLKGMALRCLLYSSDEDAAAPVRHVLIALGVEAEYCSGATEAVEKVAHQSFQIVIIDWDKQPEAVQLLTAARERKAAERPLTLAIVSNDMSIPKALQAGANSILRKPILVSQVTDTLTTARDLLLARREPPAHAAAAAAAPGALPTSVQPGGEKHLRAGEFLQSSGPAPGAQFVVESETQRALQQPATEELDPLKDLEPMAASVKAEPAQPPPAANELRGLSWYMNQRAGKAPPVPQAAAAAAAAPAQAKPELIGFDQMPSPSQASPGSWGKSADAAPESTPQPAETQEQQAEAELFAHIEGADQESQASEGGSPRSSLGKRAIIAAVVLACCAIAAAPQAPWHPKVKDAWAFGKLVVHAWLYPQPNTTAPAPASHEDFGRAGDEYKLPVAENIPDATTDPSQIRVVPVVDPTAKKPNTPDTDQTAGQADGAGTGTNPPDQPQASGIQVQETQPVQPADGSAPAASGPAAGGTATQGSAAAAAAAAAAKLRSDGPVAATPSVAPGLAQPQPPISRLPHSVSTPPTNTGIPSSLKSQMASTVPDSSGTKSPETALPSIEPVSIPEAAARGLLTDSPAPSYPAGAKGQQGTVVLQVLIGRDGAVQDAKFLQGSLAFARTAIEGVKQWKFKPYIMNARPVSVQTNLTMSFKPPS